MLQNSPAFGIFEKGKEGQPFRSRAGKSMAKIHVKQVFFCIEKPSKKFRNMVLKKRHLFRCCWRRKIRHMRFYPPDIRKLGFPIWPKCTVLEKRLHVYPRKPVRSIQKKSEMLNIIVWKRCNIWRGEVRSTFNSHPRCISRDLHTTPSKREGKKSGELGGRTSCAAFACSARIGCTCRVCGVGDRLLTAVCARCKGIAGRQHDLKRDCR